MPGLRLLTRDDDMVIGSAIRVDGLWEVVETALFVHGIETGDIVADVGAHIGYFSIVASRLAGPSGHVLAFEPEAGNFELLKANCILNGCRNVRLEHSALADHNGCAHLALSAQNSGDHRLGVAADRVCQLVEVRRFDDWWAGEGPIDFLKIDTQGCEVAALDGMAVSITRSAARLVALVEITPTLSERAGYRLSALRDLLHRLGGLPHAFASEDDTMLLRPLDDAMLSRFWNDMLRADREDAGQNLLLFFSAAARDHFIGRLAARLGPRLRTQAAME